MLLLSDPRSQELAGPAAHGRLVSITALLVCCAPLLVLAVRGWANAVLYLGALASVLVLASGQLPAARLAPPERRWARAMLVALMAPVVAVSFSALLRQDGYLPQFDAPLRFVLAIPIFLLVMRSGWPVRRVMQWALPVALLLGLAVLHVGGQDMRWAPRVTTRVVDPLVFGYFSLAFGLMCLASIAPGEWRAGRRWSVVLRLAGFALGLYLSVLSGSRSGWAAAPLVVGFWAWYQWGRRHPLGSVGVVVAVALMLAGAYLFVPAIGVRIDEGIRDVVEYPWNGVLRHETSLGYRITYLRIAADVFALHPIAGVGDTAHLAPLPASAFPYAAPEAVAGAFNSGFHNQLATNAVRSGIGGLLATAALLLVPLLVCARGVRRGAPAAMMGLAYCTCLVVSSLSTEVVDLKFTASFYAVMTAVLCGAVLGRAGAQRQTN
ncbi:hypothetical protein GCM10028796_03540 [Ramlibacter monticola]|uniref:O-antigen ligase family protein n=1 Tax=Ramlibacter monticola TaxID=1926872 RepID=A0A936YXV6_9BURK|nr:O-antigen ligase family protein [Ramlibacter monticola]MBL0391359.1 O-antigen ligase family protein [Ramlibacter monticola]